MALSRGSRPVAAKPEALKKAPPTCPKEAGQSLAQAAVHDLHLAWPMDGDDFDAAVLAPGDGPSEEAFQTFTEGVHGLQLSQSWPEVLQHVATIHIAAAQGVPQAHFLLGTAHLAQVPQAPTGQAALEHLKLAALGGSPSALAAWEAALMEGQLSEAQPELAAGVAFLREAITPGPAQPERWGRFQSLLAPEALHRAKAWAQGEIGKRPWLRRMKHTAG